jgi:hypothetical protein
MSSLHVFIYFGNWHDKIEVEMIDNVVNHAEKHYKGRIFKVSHLDVHRAEFDPPADLRVLRWRRLEPHGIPVCALQILKMGIGELGIKPIIVVLIIVSRHGISHKKRRDVEGQAVV